MTDLTREQLEARVAELERELARVSNHKAGAEFSADVNRRALEAVAADRDAALALAEETEKDKVAARLDAQNERRRADLAEQRESVAAADLAALRAWRDKVCDRIAMVAGLFGEEHPLVRLADEGRRLTGGRG